MSRYPHFRLPNLDTNTFVNETAQCSYTGPCGFGYEQLRDQKVYYWPMNNFHIPTVTNLTAQIVAPLATKALAIERGDFINQRLAYKIYPLALHFRGYYTSNSIDGDIIGLSVYWDHQCYLGDPELSDVLSPQRVFPSLFFFSTTTLQNSDNFGRFELLYRYVNNVSGSSITDLFADPEYVDFVVPLLGKTINFNKENNESTNGNLVLIFQTETGAARWTFGCHFFFSDTPYDNPP